MQIPDFDQAPLLVLWEITRACELACLHCRAEAMPCAAPGELDSTEARTLLEDMHAMGAPLVVLTGGDPLLRPDAIDLVRQGTELGLRMTMTPSVTPRLTDEALAALKEAGLARMALSLDSPDPETHDGFRGVPGTFERTLDRARKARELGISTQINTTVTTRTFPRLKEMLPLLESLDIDLWSVFFLVPVGRGALGDMLDADETEEAFRVIHDIARQASFPVKATEAPHYRRFALQNKDPSARPPMAGVNDGKGVLFIDHQGEVFPSGFLPASGGNVRKRPLAEIYRESELFQDLRDPDKLGGKCGRCEFKKVCGGSRARAFATSGDWLAEEPGCAYIPPERK
jgi:radical SAM protein with 4Fe4S-binding SPASM domain